MKQKPFSGFEITANVIMIIWTVLIIAPFVLLFMSSITAENTLVANGYAFIPKAFSGQAYVYLFKSGPTILRAYGISILVTAIGTAANLVLSVLMAYPLSQQALPGRKVMNFVVFFTMLFNGGIVPSYLLWSSLGVKDTIWAQILPNYLLSAWTVIMIRTYFTTSIPTALYEAAEIDGASQMRIMLRIAVPLAKPILITMGTFSALTYWNDWTNGLYYIVRNTNLYNIQNLLNRMVSNIQYLANSSNSNVSSAASSIPSTAIQMAIAVVAIIPILVIFPFFSKYYTKGITLGSVK